jgi:hypothetical protein
MLPDQTLDSLRKLLSDVSRSGCLIRLHTLSPKEEARGSKTIDELKALTARIGGTQGTKCIEFILQQVEITELALAEIEATLNDDDYSALEPSQQAWSALKWAGREMLDVHRSDAGRT